jgi:hypothetical protein
MDPCSSRHHFRYSRADHGVCFRRPEQSGPTASQPHCAGCCFSLAWRRRARCATDVYHGCLRVDTCRAVEITASARTRVRQMSSFKTLLCDRHAAPTATALSAATASTTTATNANLSSLPRDEEKAELDMKRSQGGLARLVMRREIGTCLDSMVVDLSPAHTH